MTAACRVGKEARMQKRRLQLKRPSRPRGSKQDEERRRFHHLHNNFAAIRLWLTFLRETSCPKCRYWRTAFWRSTATCTTRRPRSGSGSGSRRRRLAGPGPRPAKLHGDSRRDSSCCRVATVDTWSALSSTRDRCVLLLESSCPQCRAVSNEVAEAIRREPQRGAGVDQKTGAAPDVLRGPCPTRESPASKAIELSRAETPHSAPPGCAGAQARRRLHLCFPPRIRPPRRPIRRNPQSNPGV